MKLKDTFTIIIFLCFTLSPAIEAEEQLLPPKLLIDKNICPFEGCAYKEWLVASNTKLYTIPNLNSTVITILKPPEAVLAITGEIHVKPVRFLIKKNKGRYKIGDILWVYTYIGEGAFKIWFKGKMYQEELGFSPGGGNDGSYCDLDKWYCFGFFESEYKDTWWVHLETKNGIKGWSIERGQFAH